MPVMGQCMSHVTYSDLASLSEGPEGYLQAAWLPASAESKELKAAALLPEVPRMLLFQLGPDKMPLPKNSDVTFFNEQGRDLQPSYVHQ